MPPRFKQESTMKTSLKSKLFAGALTLATALAMTAGHAIAIPDAAQAGVIGSIKGAAKKVGGAVKNTAKGIGAAAKAGAYAGKQVGGVIAKYVPPVKGVINAGKAIKVAVKGRR
jgi:hypothetical protein